MFVLSMLFLVCLVVHYKYLKSLKSGYIYFRRYFRYEVLCIKQCKLLTKLSLTLKTRKIYYNLYQYIELVFILVFCLILVLVILLCFVIFISFFLKLISLYSFYYLLSYLVS